MIKERMEHKVIKKKISMLFFMFGAIALVATGCSSGQISNDYIKIAQYKGIEVPRVEGIPEITEESIDNNIKTVMTGFSKTKEITDRAAKEGDIVILDYVASSNGEPLEGGIAADYELMLGSNTFFPEFELAIVGHSKGDSFEFEHKFEEDYTNKKFAGKEVVFAITVKSINEAQVPELTDEFVQTISQKSETVKEYREEVRKLLEKNNEEYVMKELEESTWKAVLEKAEVTKYPKKKLKKEKDTFYKHYQEGAKVYGLEFTEFLKQMELTEEEFEKQITKASKSNVKENLTAELIAEKEKIELTDKQYQKAEKDLAEEMQYKDVKEMEAEVPKQQIESYILRDKVKSWVAKNCVQVDPSNS